MEKLYFWGGLKITADGDCSHEIKRCLLFGRNAMANLDSILKSRDITLPKMVRLVKAMVFLVVMYGYESWTIKKAEHQKIDFFELWCWRTLESPLDCKEIQPVHPKGDQSWKFIGMIDAEAETPRTWVWVKLWEFVRDREPWCDAVCRFTKSWTWPSNWTELNWSFMNFELSISFKVRHRLSILTSNLTPSFLPKSKENWYISFYKCFIRNLTKLETN